MFLVAGLCLVGCGSEEEQTVPTGIENVPTAAPTTGVEQAVIVHLADPDAEGVFALESLLDARISAARVGEYDGNEIALDGSEAILYAYGPDADALWQVMEPIVASTSPNAGSYAIKRYGEAGDPSAREVRIDLG